MNLRALVCGLVTCGVVSAAAWAPAAVLTNPALADTYFETYGSEAKNFGTEPRLRMDQWGGRQVFLRFALTNLPAGQRIERAQLRLFITEVGFNEAGELPDLKTCIGLFDVVTPWTETGLTWRSPDGQNPWNQGPGLPGGKYTDVGPLPQPDIGVHLRRPHIALDPAQVRPNRWLELDLTDFVRQQAQQGAAEVNVLLRSSTLGRNYTFASREAKQVEQHPQLVIETAPGPEPPARERPVPQPAPHPRLYVTAQTLPKLRAQMQRGARLFAAWRRWVDAGQAGAAQGRFHDMGPHEGCENTALAWLLTGDRRYLTNSLAYARRILSRRMSEHFHDVHEATFTGAAWVHAMACHYDWCHDQLDPAHRQAVVAWLKEAARWSWVRSGAPIAHNDGGARQCLLGSVALALLGDDPEAPELYRLSRENFEKNLLPWLNDGGRGGRSGDGGEYEGLHGFYIVRFAWMSRTAVGEDVFSESPFFFNRLKHILYGWYPRRLVARDGSYSLRQYYSPSGDHIRLGYVGDTQPYQSAAALCARYSDTAEAAAVRWLAGQWPTAWMQYCLKWAVLADWESLPARDPSGAGQAEGALPLAYLDPGCHTVYLRSDWSDDATWILFENAPYVSAHTSLDSGTFEIFKGDLLAARTGNLDHANVGARHTMNYLHRTVAGNCLLINDPAEKWKGFLGGAEGIHDGGGQRSNWPLSSSPDADTYQTYRHVFQRGQITRFAYTNAFTYACADLTPAYTSPHFHNGNLNRPKVSRVTRQLLYLRGLDTLVVFDRVRSTRPEFKKTWLLHSLGELDVLDGRETKVDEGEFHYTGATRAVLRYGWPKPVPSFGRCLSVTVLPENAQLTKIGGRVDLPEGQTEGWPGDRWHGQHRHRHIKDFWVNGTNYPPGNPPETRWFGEPTSPWYVPGTPDESGGRGKWRLEVSPPEPALDDVFLHVLCPRLGWEGPFPQVERLRAGEFDGALVREGGLAVAVFFARSEQPATHFSAILPAGPVTLLVADLAPGDYTLHLPGQASALVRVEGVGLLALTQVSGAVEVSQAR